ncbi:MAG: glycosyltransferase family 9 protein, partial [Planctomycetes bacterium]|nr:glycosyltransferase family 9 protein [Planctomycetota bacterium]
IYDVGLNYHVGPKWPTKAWPIESWRDLHNQLSKKGLAVSWQQSLNSVRQYIDWIASCRMIITTDSLGLHLGLALKKQMVALFGATASEQIHLYGQGLKLTPACDRGCLPCFQAKCDFEQSCMEFISVDMVLDVMGVLGVGQEVTKGKKLVGIGTEF